MVDKKSTQRPRQWLERELKRSKRLTTQTMAAQFGISRQAAHRYLARAVKEGLALKLGQRRSTYYVLNEPKLLEQQLVTQRFLKTYLRGGLEEDRAFTEIEARGSLRLLSPAAHSIVHYACTELLSNAIDHSGSKRVTVSFGVNREQVDFRVTDQGVGIFHHIRKSRRLADDWEAIEELMKGKLTTMPEAHSGEGIFFTSKIADRFEIDSFGKLLVFDNRQEDIFVKDVRKRRGTQVSFWIASQTRKKLTDLFREYTNEDYEFDKTQVTVKLYARDTEYVSRSQAKRLLTGLEKFQRVVLDFKGVETIGQAFADQVFRVGQKRYPKLTIDYSNANENVSFMIKRARA